MTRPLTHLEAATRGGKSTKKKGTSFFKRISRLGHEARWGRKLKDAAIPKKAG